MPLPTLFPGTTPDTTAMWTRCRLIDMLYGGDTDGIVNLARQWGNASLVYYRYRSASWPPSFALLNVDDSWELVLTGTANIQQVGLHVGGVVSVLPAPPGGVLSGTWAAMAALVWAEALANGLGGVSPNFLTISGHSYGGAVAGILGMSAAARFGSQRTQIITFGCPRYRGGPIAAAQPGWNARVVNEADPVPLLPPQYGSAAVIAVAKSIVSKRSRLIPWKHVGFRTYLPLAGGVVYSGDGQEEPASVVTWVQNPGIQAHGIAEYGRRLLRTGQVRFPEDNSEQWSSGTPGWNRQQTILDKIPKDGGLDVSVANQVYYGAPTGPIAADNLSAFESTALRVLSAQVSLPTNIGRSLRGILVATNSGFTKVTLVINNGRYGHTESHIVALPIDSSNLSTVVSRLAGYRKTMLGNGTIGAGPYVKSSATPQIQFVRLTDAIVPRLGQVYDWTDKQYFGFPSVSTPNNAADFGSVAMTVRPRSGDGVNPPKNTTLQLVFNPDSLYNNGAFDPTYAPPAQEAWAQQLAYYVAYLRGAGGVSWGIMGDNPATPPLQCTAVAAVNGQYQFTFPGSTWATGDRVRFAKFGTVFNKTWTLVKIADTVYALRRQPVSGHTLPPLGTAVLVQLANGASNKVFLPYIGIQLTEGGAIQVKPAKHNPGKEWISVSFAHRVRRER